MKKFIALLGVLLTLPTVFAETKTAIPQYRQISGIEAKKMLETNKDAILVDVRTPGEYALQRIPGSILLPDYELAEKAEKAFPKKDTPLIVYCRSGNRSRNSVQWLLKQGYTNVYDLGGIYDWPYETVGDN